LSQHGSAAKRPDPEIRLGEGEVNTFVPVEIHQAGAAA
jgi:hypothetical protein